MKIEVLNLKASRSGSGGSPAEKQADGLKELPDTPEELRWQLLTTLRLLRREQTAAEELEQRLRKITLLAEDTVRAADKVDPKKRALFEDEMRAVRKLLGPAGPDRKHITETGQPENVDVEALKKVRVAEYRKQLSLVVLNVGREHGVRAGMPFDIVRDDKLVATVYVVEVREKICGALIERMDEKNPVKEEDRAVLRKT